MIALISRADAMAQGLSRYFTGKPCRKGHIAERYVNSCTCHCCALENQKAYRDKNPDYHQSRMRTWYEKNKEYAQAYGRTRHQANKVEIAEKRRFSNLSPERQAALRAASAEWRAANKQAKATQERNRRALKRQAVGCHTAKDIAKLADVQDLRCPYCRTSIAGRFHVDHIVPLSRGGSNGVENLQLLCQPCNQRKHAKDPEQFAREIGSIL